VADLVEKEQTLKAWRKLSVSAALALALHLAAALALAIVLRFGLETAVDFPHRISFLVHQKTFWVSGWLLWNASALSILYFFFSYYLAHKAAGGLQLRLLSCACLIGVAAVAADLSAEAIEMFVLPNYAKAILVSPAVSLPVRIEHFYSMHRTAVILTGYLANGLYTTSVALIMLATARQYRPLIITAGSLVIVGGIWLSIASLTNSVKGMVWSNLLLMPSLLVWLAGVVTFSRMRARLLEEQSDNLLGRMNGCADDGTVREAEPND